MRNYSMPARCLLAVLLLAGCYGDAYIHVKGRIVDRDGRPVSNAHVELVPDPSKYPDYSAVSQKTSENGEFSLSQSLPATGLGTSTLSIDADGFRAYTRKYINEIHDNEIIQLEGEMESS